MFAHHQRNFIDEKLTQPGAYRNILCKTPIYRVWHRILYYVLKNLKKYRISTCLFKQYTSMKPIGSGPVHVAQVIGGLNRTNVITNNIPHILCRIKFCRIILCGI